MLILAGSDRVELSSWRDIIDLVADCFSIPFLYDLPHDRMRMHLFLCER